LPTHPLVGEARGVGLISAVHIVADKASRAPVPPAAGMGPLIQQRAMDRGLLIRAAPDAVHVCPPLIITKAEIDELVACVLEDRNTSIDVFEAQQTMEVCLAADRSAELGGAPVACRDQSPWPGFAENTDRAWWRRRRIPWHPRALHA
jgi:hypothetical protein